MIQQTHSPSIRRDVAIKPDAPETAVPATEQNSTDSPSPGWPTPGAHWLPAQKSNAPSWLTDEANRRWRRSRFPRDC